MPRNHQSISVGGMFVLFVVLLNAVILELGYVSSPKWYALEAVAVPLLILSFFKFRKN